MSPTTGTSLREHLILYSPRPVSCSDTSTLVQLRFMGGNQLFLVLHHSSPASRPSRRRRSGCQNRTNVCGFWIYYPSRQSSLLPSGWPHLFDLRHDCLPLTHDLQSYWNPGSGYITANTGGGRSGKDSNTVLTSIHTFDPAAGCDTTTFQPCSDKALSNLKVYVDSFRSIYGVNSGIASSAPVAVGRYPEDVYFNGNPWYLSVFAVAEQLYDALIVWRAQGSLEVTSTSLAFFRQFSSSVAVGTYASSTSTFQTLTSAIQTYADGFIAINAKFTPSNGGLSEQFDKNSGTPLSAVDLTWSYASALTAFAARNGFSSPSWGAKGLTVPSACSSNSGPTVAVTFNVQATTTFGGMRTCFPSLTLMI
jgi:hypothetical protein